MSTLASDHTCPFCISNKARFFHTASSFGYQVRYYQCTICGLIFQDQQESQAADPDFYAQTYRTIYQQTESPTAKDLRVQKQRAEHTLQWIMMQGIPNVDRALDIGASAGVFLDEIRSQLQCNVMGVEPGEVYRAFAQDKGLTIFPSLNDLKRQTVNKFDLISLMHVLEHLPDPLASLEDLRTSLLQSNGYLLIEVPNFYAHDSYELAHLVCFTPFSLKQLVKQAGFKIIATRLHGFPRSKLLPLYITLLASPNQGNQDTKKIKRDLCVRQKRTFAMFHRRVVQKLFPHMAWLPLKDVQA